MRPVYRTHRAQTSGDVEALDALVDDDDAGELLVLVTEVLVGALTKLVGPEELSRQVLALSWA